MTTNKIKKSRKRTKVVELGLKTRHTNLKNGGNQQMLKRWALYIPVQQINNNNDKTTTKN